MKKIIFLILFIILSLNLVSCGQAKNNETGKTDKNEIIYLTDLGKKIESLSEEKQSMISNYVEDCKILFLREYKEEVLEKHIQNAFVDFSDVFVFDFINVDETKLDQHSLKIWEIIKIIRNNEVKPLMYIQINGYCQYYNLPSNFDEFGGITHGYFIYTDNTVVPYMYRSIMAMTSLMDIVNGTTIINCGNKYSQKTTLADILEFDDELKTLKLVG